MCMGNQPALCGCVCLTVSDALTIKRVWLRCRAIMTQMFSHAAAQSPCSREAGGREGYIYGFFSVSHRPVSEWVGVLSAGPSAGTSIRTIAAPISLVPVHPSIVRLMVRWVKPQGRSATCALHQATEGIPLFPLDRG